MYFICKYYTRAVDVEEVERLFDLLLLLRRQLLAAAFDFPVAGGIGKRLRLISLVRARLHPKVQISAMLLSGKKTSSSKASLFSTNKIVAIMPRTSARTAAYMSRKSYLSFYYISRKIIFIPFMK